MSSRSMNVATHTMISVHCLRSIESILVVSSGFSTGRFARRNGWAGAARSEGAAGGRCALRPPVNGNRRPAHRGGVVAQQVSDHASDLLGLDPAGEVGLGYRGAV